MTYNLKYYSQEKAKNRDKYFKNTSVFFENGIDTNKIFFDFILNYLNTLNKDNIKILDIGTGTGYVPEILCKLSKLKFRITAVDLSKNMLEAAKQKQLGERVRLVLADNNHLPFNKNTFDIVTNKLSTQFSVGEVHRVLKNEGIFVFKEYGEYKGFKEVFDIFRERYKKSTKQYMDYVNELYKFDFENINLNLYKIKRLYSLEELNNIFKMANLIDNFSDIDLKKIKNKMFGVNVNKKIKITSDPFIIFAKK